QLRRFGHDPRRGEQLAGGVEVDARSGVQRRLRRREGLSGRAAHYFAAFWDSEASRSARKRSTTAWARSSSERVSPTTPPARSRARVPTSLRSETNVDWRSASICA